MLYFTGIFPSNCVEEQPLQSLTGVYNALHTSIGEVMFASQNPAELAQNNIFFFSHSYLVPKKVGLFGKLEEIPNPPLNSPEWPKPDAWTILCLKCKMVHDIKTSLKFSKASRSVGLNWFCPMHVFVHMFNFMPVHQTKSMYICKELGSELMQGLLGEDWDINEGSHQGDVYRCNVVDSSVTFRFLKARSILYMRMHYQRWMQKKGKWIPLQASKEEIMSIEVVVLMPNGWVERVAASKHWSLADLREHLIIMGFDNAEDSSFKLMRRKVYLRLSRLH